MPRKINAELQHNGHLQSLRWNPLPATLLPILEKEVSGPTAFHADQLKLWQPAVLKISDFFDETGQGFEPVKKLS